LSLEFEPGELMRELSLRMQPENRKLLRINHGLFTLLLLLLVGGAILRSAIATRLDDFTIDEAYHIGAGVSYVQRADFRLNPEHPPLVKLWVGSLMSATGFQLSAFREFHDKFDERTFAEEAVLFHNDPDSVQGRSRVAMWTLNGLLLIALSLALRRSFGPAVALGTILFLAIGSRAAGGRTDGAGKPHGEIVGCGSQHRGLLREGLRSGYNREAG
jgi:hypothetical protein